MKLPALALAALLTLPLLPHAASVAQPTRDLQAVVIPGALLRPLAADAVYLERPPAPMTEETQGDGIVLGTPGGAPVDHVRAARWDGVAFAPIPTQVDERFPRYLTNYASGFGIYSQSDLELTYAFDEETVRKTCDDGVDTTHATFCSATVTTPDPIPGLDTDDEVVVMWADAGARAPATTERVEVALTDPLSQETRYVYIDDAGASFVSPRSYVSYAPDADADTYVQSNHGSYGGAPGGDCYPGDGVDSPWGAPRACDHRRPKDSATVTTDAYQFHYAGRWKMDGLQVKQPDGSWSDSLIDRWKGRAFQQREGNAADVGGFEDENDWAKSSVTLGVRAGPVRVLRETWGADSGTDVTRLDVFYPNDFEQRYHLRVHPIPPDGLYAFWDHRAGMVDTYYTAVRPQGVPIDGAGDEIYGTNSEWQQDLLGQSFFTIDATDPTLQSPTTNEMWDEVAGPYGSLVTYIHTPPGVQAGALTSYYRDDATFDDGTGTDPGSFGAHGIHFFATGDTDNLFLPAPVDEFVAISTQYVLAGRAPNVGETLAELERAPVTATSGAPSA